MAKFIPISQTSLSTYQTCPRQFQAKYVTKEVVFQETAATAFGNRLHTALEHRIRDRIPLPGEFTHLEWVGQLLDGMEGHAEVYVERKLAVDRDFKPCAWNAWNVKYLNGKDDCTVIKGKRAVQFDWKSGKVKAERQQLEILAMLTFAHHPQVEEVHSGLVFFQAGELIPFKAIRASFDPVELKSEFRRYEIALANDSFKPTPNGLCREWCDVLSCPHNGRGR